MDRLPNELQEMVASYLPTKDLCSYRLVNQQWELVANRLLFETVLVNFDTINGYIKIRPDIAQFIKRLHIDTHENPCDTAGKLDNFIEQIASAGAKVTELCISLDGEDDPVEKAERLMMTLASHAFFFSNITHFSITNQDMNYLRPTTQVTLEALLKFLDSMNALQHVHIDMWFLYSVDRTHLKRLWKIFLTHYDCCPE